METLSKPSIRVGDEVVLTLQFSPDEISKWELPAKGFLNKEENEDLPYAEIIDIVKNNTQIQIKVVYFESGEFIVPVSWFDMDDTEFRSQKIITVKSVLQGEKDLLDITDPIAFSGPYLIRLIFLILGIVLVVTAILFAISYLKNKYKNPMDAIIEPNNSKELHYYRDKINGIQDSLHTEIRHKDFIYILSGYIKEIITNQTGTFIFHKSQEEINEILKNRYNISPVQLEKLTIYFNSVKYMPNNEMISHQKAVELAKYWRELLQT
ncbi:MAG: hypothetical protein H7A23_10470 [Leptospiraceae bacterium]|nr:hypothetical protein [Leptospiraceae bacterium]MCP5494968.1 hypothetical protein [Leptospiraceae bacterium]